MIAVCLKCSEKLCQSKVSVLCKIEESLMTSFYLAPAKPNFKYVDLLTVHNPPQRSSLNSNKISSDTRVIDLSPSNNIIYMQRHLDIIPAPWTLRIWTGHKIDLNLVNSFKISHHHSLFRLPENFDPNSRQNDVIIEYVTVFHLRRWPKWFQLQSMLRG